MKKIIAVLIALAMVLSMSVMAFASWTTADGKTISSPSEITSKAVWEDARDYTATDLIIDPNLGSLIDRILEQEIYTSKDNSLRFISWDEAWAKYYDVVLSGATSNPTGAITEIVNSVKDGNVEIGDAITNIGNSVSGGAGGDGNTGDLSGVVSGIIDQITGGAKEPEISTADYVEELKALINSGATAEEVTGKIGEDLGSGKIVLNQLPDIAKGLTELIDAGEIENNETVQKILEYIGGLGGEGDSSFPSFGDITLPGQGGSESGSFLDTILGIIGSIGELFNPTPDEPTEPTEPDGNETPNPIPNTGDVSFVAVAAVAAVAGVALVLTRKKNDAE